MVFRHKPERQRYLESIKTGCCGFLTHCSKSDKSNNSEETLKKRRVHTSGSGSQRLSCSCLLACVVTPWSTGAHCCTSWFICCFVRGRLQAVLLWLRYVNTAPIGVWFLTSCCLRAKEAQAQKGKKKGKRTYKAVFDRRPVFVLHFFPKFRKLPCSFVMCP